MNVNPIPVIPPAISIIKKRLLNTEWYKKKIWKDRFTICWDKSCEFSKDDVLFLIEQKSLFRFFTNTFKVEHRKHPTPNDFAIVIAFELLESGRNYDSKSVIKFSELIWREWHNFIAENNYFNNLFKQHRGIYVGEYINSLNERDLSYHNDLETVLKDCMMLRQEFFKTYTEERGKENVTIYIKNKHNYVDWKKKESVSISLHSLQAVDSGFYRVGYDYESNGRRLQSAYAHKQYNLETGIFSGDKKNEIFKGYDNLLWFK